MLIAPYSIGDTMSDAAAKKPNDFNKYALEVVTSMELEKRNFRYQRKIDLMNKIANQIPTTLEHLANIGFKGGSVWQYINRSYGWFPAEVRQQCVVWDVSVDFARSFLLTTESEIVHKPLQSDYIPRKKVVVLESLDIPDLRSLLDSLEKLSKTK